jgi:hypothetical protein
MKILIYYELSYPKFFCKYIDKFGFYFKTNIVCIISFPIMHAYYSVSYVLISIPKNFPVSFFRYAIQEPNLSFIKI